MPDGTNEMLIVASVGGAGGLAGGAVSALSENMTRRQVVATVISSLGFGSFVPPAVMSVWQLHPGLAGIVGFVCGLTCVSLVAGVQRVGKAVSRNPGKFIRQLKNITPEDDTPIPEKEGKQ
jgi:hypothetical protein